ncbi:MAG: hypothetical protein WKF35_04980 [Ferruginibacter sp.]
MSLFGNIRDFFMYKKQKSNTALSDGNVYTSENIPTDNNYIINEGSEENNDWNSDPGYDTGVDSSGTGNDSGGSDSGGGDGGGSSD